MGSPYVPVGHSLFFLFLMVIRPGCPFLYFWCLCSGRINQKERTEILSSIIFLSFVMQTAGETTLIKKNPPSVDDKKKGKEEERNDARMKKTIRKKDAGRPFL